MGRAEKRAMTRENRKTMSVGMAKKGIVQGLQDGYRRGYEAGLEEAIATMEAATLLALRDVLGLGAKRMDAIREKIAQNIGAMSLRDPSGEHWMTIGDAYDTIKEEVYHGNMRSTEDICRELKLIE